MDQNNNHLFGHDSVGQQFRLGPVGWFWSSMYSIHSLLHVRFSGLDWALAFIWGFRRDNLADSSLPLQTSSSLFTWDSKNGAEVCKVSWAIGWSWHDISLLPTACHKGNTVSKGRKIDSPSWWEKLQRYIVKGKTIGRGGELRSFFIVVNLPSYTADH